MSLADRGIPLKFAYTGVEVKDMDASIRFYVDGLSMELLDRHRIQETKGEVAALRSPGSEQLLELNWYPNATYRVGSELDHLAFEVKDVPGTVEKLVQHGARRCGEVEKRPKYIVGFVQDPNGIWIELFEARTG